jgi:hypothetical protein
MHARPPVDCMDTLPVFFSFFLYAGQPCIEIDLAND